MQFHAHIAVVFYKGRQPFRQDIAVAAERSDVAQTPSAKGQVHKLGSAEVINFAGTLATFVRGAIAQSKESVCAPHEDGKEREGVQIKFGCNHKGCVERTAAVPTRGTLT